MNEIKNSSEGHEKNAHEEHVREEEVLHRGHVREEETLHEMHVHEEEELRREHEIEERKEVKFEIIVNGRDKNVSRGTVTYDEIVALAFNPIPTGPNVLITVAYEDGPLPKPDGTLLAGESVCIKNGMAFYVTATDKS